MAELKIILYIIGGFILAMFTITGFAVIVTEIGRNL
jgi:hypothetical protein